MNLLVLQLAPCNLLQLHPRPLPPNPSFIIIRIWYCLFRSDWLYKINEFIGVTTCPVQFVTTAPPAPPCPPNPSFIIIRIWYCLFRSDWLYKINEFIGVKTCPVQFVTTAPQPLPPPPPTHTQQELNTKIKQSHIANNTRSIYYTWTISYGLLNSLSNHVHWTSWWSDLFSNKFY